MRPIFHNVVSEEKMREVQKETLQIIKDRIATSFGPYGRNSMILGGSGAVKFSKDGHTILKAIKFQETIEEAVRESMVDITRDVVKKVGDGTTSAVILSHFIFEEMQNKVFAEYTAYDIVRAFEKVALTLKEDIRTRTKEFTPKSAYDLTMVATNGNEVMSSLIEEVYERFGNDAFIDVSISTDDQTKFKLYDGLTLESPYADVGLINTRNGKVSHKWPKIFIFDDPIDNGEMMVFFDRIIQNLIMAFSDKSENSDKRPVVIFAPKISRDLSSYMENLISGLSQVEDVATKLPINIITNIHERDILSDIATLVGAKCIHKYIDQDQHRSDVENGLAPTLETIGEFCGSAELVESDARYTKVVNPALMYDIDNDGHRTPSLSYKTLILHLESELERANDTGMDINYKGVLKRRIQSLKANLVELLVGGISMADRDALKDLVEDAVLSCRSAAKNGYGFASNVEALYSVSRIDFAEYGELEKLIAVVLKTSYVNLVTELYENSKVKDIKSVIGSVTANYVPYNVRTKAQDIKVIASIEADCVVLDAVVKIITLIITSAQFITPAPVYNKYEQPNNN